jgi:elongator complex protein 4
MFAKKRAEPVSIVADSKQEFSNDFDLRKRLEWHLLNAQHIQCLRTQVVDTLSDLQNRCFTFLYNHPR